MENSSIDTPYDDQPSSGANFALYVAIGAILVGGLGLAFGVVNRNQVQSTTQRIEGLINEVNKTVDGRLVEVQPSVNDQELVRALEGKLETLETQSRANIEALKNKCEALEKAIQALHANRGAGTPPPASAGTQNRPTPPQQSQTSTSAQIDPAAPGDTKEYVVQKGDNFYKIGRTVGCSVKELQNLNPGVDAAKLKVGQKIVVPAK